MLTRGMALDNMIGCRASLYLHISCTHYHGKIRYTMPLIVRGLEMAFQSKPENWFSLVLAKWPRWDRVIPAVYVRNPSRAWLCHQGDLAKICETPGMVVAQPIGVTTTALAKCTCTTRLPRPSDHAKKPDHQ
jgi:hypothetical protein